ncbi:MAG: tRNA uridine(34) 5-carboxymethylaminomethyl modification radical SAM/GNAT enzyme Elp3, partial [Candidatus Nanoarchaeia archaeon]
MTEAALYEDLISYIKEEHPTKDQLAKKKNILCKKHGVTEIPTDITIMLHATAADRNAIKGILLTKPVRTQSGVSVVAIMTKPISCPHGKCTYCPGGMGSPYGDMPQSYTGKEPSTMRGIRNDYEAYLQVFTRLEQYVAIGHRPGKVELIVMGGTFTAFPSEYQEDVIKYSFKAMNDFSSMFYTDGELDLAKFKEFFELPGDLQDEERLARIKKKLYELKGECSLEEEQLKNETSGVRCVGLTIETKPDWAKEEHANAMLRFGCTRIELGVQSVYEDVISAVHRGHTIKDTVESFRILKDCGFKINAHYMPGLPLTDKERDLRGLKQLFSDPDYRPDMLKIYPCMVAPGTALYHDWKAGKFEPLNTDDAAKMINEFQKFIPTYCRVQRVQRDVPTKQWAAGVGITNLKQYMD